MVYMPDYQLSTNFASYFSNTNNYMAQDLFIRTYCRRIFMLIFSENLRVAYA